MIEGQRPPFDLGGELLRLSQEEHKQKARTQSVVAEITLIGDSTEFGTTISNWILLRDERQRTGLNEIGRRNFRILGTVLQMAFGEEGLEDVATALKMAKLDRAPQVRRA